jgi:ankyrin repeat protein
VAEAGHLDVVKLLIECGASVDDHPRPDGATPLLIATQNGKLDVVKLLIECSAAIDMSRIDGATPLNIAVQFGHSEIVKLFIERGATLHQNKPSVFSSTHWTF